MKKKIFLFWDGEFDAGIRATEATITVEFDNLLPADEYKDEENAAAIEKHLQAFGAALQREFEADQVHTEQTLKEQDEWCAKEMENL